MNVWKISSSFVLLVKACLHDEIHGGIANLADYVVIQIAAEKAVLNAFPHELTRMGGLLLLITAEKLKYAPILLHLRKEQRVYLAKVFQPQA